LVAAHDRSPSALTRTAPPSQLAERPRKLLLVVRLCMFYLNSVQVQHRWIELP
jgi:hypothetical protein